MSSETEDQPLVARPTQGDAFRDQFKNLRFYKPRVVLTVFIFVNFLTYYDRGVMGASMDTIRTDKSIAGHGSVISAGSAGMLVSSFMIGFFLTSPIFAALGGIVSSKVIIIVGLVAWIAACIGSSMSMGFGMLLACRALVGVGEAAFAGFSVTMIDNVAPRAQRTRWIGAFYSMIPTGTAIGMAGGGLIGAKASFRSVAGWRVAFFTETLPMVPVVIYLLFLPSIYNTVKQKTNLPVDDVQNTTPGDVEESAEENAGRVEHVPLLRAARLLFTNPSYVCLVLGYATYTFVLGAISVWAISMAAEGPLHLSRGIASLIIGISTAFAGLVGAFGGGMLVDRWGGSLGPAGVSKCALFSVGSMCVSLPFGVIALLTTNLTLFVIMFVTSVLALFFVTAPINTSFLTVVPRELRTYAVTFSIFGIHLLGDVPSPIIAGALSDAFNGGCGDFSHNQTMCDGARNCIFKAATKNTDEYCHNEFQLRNALVIVFSVISLAIPLWTYVFFVQRKLAAVSALENSHRE